MIDNLLLLIPAIIALASTVAALTPTPKDDAALSGLYKIIDALALNLGYAKQKGDDK